MYIRAAGRSKAIPLVDFSLSVVAVLAPFFGWPTKHRPSSQPLRPRLVSLIDDLRLKRKKTHSSTRKRAKRIKSSKIAAAAAASTKAKQITTIHSKNEIRHFSNSFAYPRLRRIHGIRFFSTLVSLDCPKQFDWRITL
jgi:hypothetical protein